MNRKISFACIIKNSISFLYLAILIYNLVAAKFIPAAINLLLFVCSFPIFFSGIKSKYARWFHAFNMIAAVCTIALIVVTIATTIIGSQNTTNDTIPAAEQHYIDTVLLQITSESSKNDVIALLGEPDRDLVSKVNWWVNIEGESSRVGVYFSIQSGKATEIVLDGGLNRFYYRKSLE